MVSKRENTKYCKYTVALFIHTGMSCLYNVLTGFDSFWRSILPLKTSRVKTDRREREI